MKHFFIIALCLFMSSAFAQELTNIEVTRESSYYNTQVFYIVDIPQANLATVESNWLQYVSQKRRNRGAMNDGTYMQYNARNKNISSDPFDVYSTLIESSTGVRLRVWLMANGEALTSGDPKRDVNMAIEKYLRDYAVGEYRNAVRQELEVEQQKQGELEDELSVLIKAQEKSFRKINDNERLKEKSEEAIITKNSDLRSTSYRIYDQKELVEEVASDPNAQKGAEKTLKELETEKRDLQKAIDQQGRNVEEKNKEKREVERSLTGSQQLIAFKMADIEKQRGIIRNVKLKLEKIR